MAVTPKEKEQVVKPRGPIKEGTKQVVGQAVTRPRRRRIPMTCVACEDAHFCYAMVLAKKCCSYFILRAYICCGFYFFRFSLPVTCFYHLPGDILVAVDTRGSTENGCTWATDASAWSAPPAAMGILLILLLPSFCVVFGAPRNTFLTYVVFHICVSLVLFIYLYVCMYYSILQVVVVVVARA